MTGFELRLWRRGCGWTQERAAEELGISLRTYITYELSVPPLIIILASQAIEMKMKREDRHQLKPWRKSLHWTQKQAADSMGISLRTYITYEKTSSSLAAELASLAISANNRKFHVNLQPAESSTITEFF